MTFRVLTNQPLLENIIPASTTTLIFSDNFNQSLKPGDIPSSVTKLELGIKYNQLLVPGCIPSSVKVLVFGHEIQHCFDRGVIPDSVTHLSLYKNFGSTIIGQHITNLPSSITHLRVGSRFNCEIDINLDTKITCSPLNYKYFLTKKFRFVSFITKTNSMIDRFRDNYIEYNDCVYTVTIKNIDKFSKISLKLKLTPIKSARKI